MADDAPGLTDVELQDRPLALAESGARSVPDEAGWPRWWAGGGLPLAVLKAAAAHSRPA